MSERIGFIGLGNMGMPMLEQLLKADFRVTAYDLCDDSLKNAAGLGAQTSNSISEIANAATLVITMLPASAHVRSVYFDKGGLIETAQPGTLLIDSSTIDVDTSREVGAAAVNAGLEMIDAPVTGGVMAARIGKLNFIIGGEQKSFERARPVLSIMGQNLLYAGPQGSGIGVKICNNMSLGISMIAAAETLMMAKRLGLDLKRTYEIITNASGQNWALNNYCPLPGFIEGVPSNDGYKPGFSAEMMRKDLRLSQDAALSVNACTPLAAHALSIYSHFCDGGDSQTDYSGISKLIGGDAWDYLFEPKK